MPLSFEDSNAALQDAFCLAYPEFPPCNHPSEDFGNLGESDKFILYDAYRGIPETSQNQPDGLVAGKVDPILPLMNEARSVGGGSEVGFL